MLVEGFAAMHKCAVCEERLKPEAPGTKPCFPCSLEKMSGASRLLMILGQCAVYAGVRRSDCRFASGSVGGRICEAVGEDPAQVKL
jgi:hypothetical protein